MRHAVRWVALGGLLFGISILAVTVFQSDNRGQVFEAAATDFAVAFVEIAITVGVVDLLLKSYSERQHRQSVIPRVEELVLHLRNLSTLIDRYLSAPSLADLERYRRVAVDVQQSAFGLYILMSNANAVFASELLRLSHQMREHVEAVEDAMASCRNASTDADNVVERLKQSGAELFESGSQLTDRLTIEYPSEALR